MFFNILTTSEMKEKIKELESLKNKISVEKEYLKELKEAYRWQTKIDLNECIDWEGYGVYYEEI